MACVSSKALDIGLLHGTTDCFFRLDLFYIFLAGAIFHGKRRNLNDSMFMDANWGVRTDIISNDMILASFSLSRAWLNLFWVFVVLFACYMVQAKSIFFLASFTHILFWTLKQWTAVSSVQKDSSTDACFSLMNDSYVTQELNSKL